MQMQSKENCRTLQYNNKINFQHSTVNNFITLRDKINSEMVKMYISVKICKLTLFAIIVIFPLNVQVKNKYLLTVKLTGLNR